MSDEKKKTTVIPSEEFEQMAAAVALGAATDEETARLSELLKNSDAAMKTTFDDFRRINRGLASLSEAHAEPPPEVKDRLLQSVRTAEAPVLRAEFAFIKQGEGEWQLMAPGITFKNLFNNPDNACTTMLLRMAAGSTLPAHDHDHLEELYVLEGDCYCAGECLRAGDYHRAAGGSQHGVTFTEHGCLMIVHTSRSAAAA